MQRWCGSLRWCFNGSRNVLTEIRSSNVLNKQEHRDSSASMPQFCDFEKWMDARRHSQCKGALRDEIRYM